MTEKKGLLIGFISPGTIPTKWMVRIIEMSQGIPAGVFWKFGWFDAFGKDFVKDQGGYAEARNKVVRQAKAMNMKWLFFIDTDVIPPVDAITQLMSNGKKVVSGIYYMKCMPPQPVMFKTMGAGPYWDYPVDETFKIEGSGAGCMLIDMDVFDKFDEASIPYFNENFIFEKEDGTKVKVPLGEDHWFFMKCKELGIETYCDSKVICDHMDIKTGVLFPGKDEYARIRKKVLVKNGRTDILEMEEKLKQLKPNRKTIAFFDTTGAEYSGDEFKHRGVGGAESAIIYTAKELAKYYNVFVFCSCPRPGIYDGVKYVNLDQADLMKEVKVDLLVVQRNCALVSGLDLKEMFKVDKIAIWLHDLATSPIHSGIGATLNKVSKYIVPSKWHMQNIIKQFPGMNENMFIVIPHGVDSNLFRENVTRNKYKLLYSSTPFRGLKEMLDVFPEIKKQVPEAELYVTSSMKVYNNKDKESKEFEELYNRARNIDGVKYIGTVKKDELAKHFMESRMWSYPNTYEETFCIGAIESISAGTPIVTSCLGALPEVIPRGCSLTSMADPKSEQFKQDFINNCVRLLKDDSLWNKMNEECNKHNFDWSKSSLKWVENFFKEDLQNYSEACLINEVKKDIKLYDENSMNDFNNINTPEYWNSVYSNEVSHGATFRENLERYELLKKYIKQSTNQYKLLDYGCGTGEYIKWLRKEYPSIELTAVDFSTVALNKIKSEDKTVEIYTDLPEGKKFDFISCQHVMEHINRPEILLNKFKEHLNENGIVVIALPLNDDPWHEHVKIYQEKDVIELLNKVDCSYKLIKRKNNLVKQNGDLTEEIIAIVRFD